MKFYTLNLGKKSINQDLNYLIYVHIINKLRAGECFKVDKSNFKNMNIGVSAGEF